MPGCWSALRSALPGGGLPGPAGCGAVVELGADVAFEPEELGDKRGGVGSSAGRGGSETGAGHGDLDAAEPAPAAEAAFDGRRMSRGISLPSLAVISGLLCTPGGREVMRWGGRRR